MDAQLYMLAGVHARVHGGQLLFKPLNLQSDITDTQFACWFFINKWGGREWVGLMEVGALSRETVW